MARLVINDGYTLEGVTTDTVTNPVTGAALASGLPVVAFRYRPALPDALAEWRYAMRTAGSGKAELDATAKLLAEHLVSWDVTDARGAEVPVTAAGVRKVPEAILNQMLDAVTTWAPEKAAGALGNSGPASGSPS